MQAITRGVFTVVVLSAVLSALFIACFDPARATGTAAPAARNTQVKPRLFAPPAAAPVRAAAAPAQVSIQGAAQGAMVPVQAAAARLESESVPMPEVTVTVTVTPRPSPKPSLSPRPIRVGYVPQRGAYGATSTVRDLEESGQASRLTHAVYAFANIDPTSLTCLAGVTRPPAPDPEDPDQGDGAGDAWADYQRGFTAAESLDGRADPPDARLAGNFNQLKKLKARHPNLRTLISIGGWTYSKYFSDVARTAATRQRFVKSCLDAYIRGDLPGVGSRGGPGSAAGVFDGIDVDWEWPGGEGHLGNHVGAEDKRHLTALLAEFRAQLDALGAANGRRYLLTVYVPAEPDRVKAGFDLQKLTGVVDFVTVQSGGRHALREGTILR